MSKKNPDAEEQTVFVADTVDEFVERTRLQQILEAKNAAAEALQNSRIRHMEAIQSGMSKTEAERVASETARAAVASYVLECEQIYRRTENGHRLWTEAPLAEMDIRDGISLDMNGEMKNIKEIRLNGERVDNPERGIELQGVQQFVGLSPDVEITYERELPRRGKPLETVTDRFEWSTPVWVSREAYRATNALLADSELGVKVDTEDESGEWENDYRDTEK